MTCTIHLLFSKLYFTFSAPDPTKECISAISSSLSPLPRVLSLWPFQSPVIGDLLSDLPYLAPSLCFQGALSTSETEYLLHPYKVPKQWGNGVCQSSPDENKSRIQNLSAVTASSYELSQVAKLGHREGKLISKTPCSGGYRPWCICHWKGMSLLI